MKKTFTTRFYIVFIGCLISVFAFYNYSLYTGNVAKYELTLSNKAIEGQQLWIQKNCASCHQLYGLGGYLGPDITNICSDKNKGPEYVKAFLNTGVKSMPKFNFTEKEKENIAAFLQEVDKTGFYPNYKAIIQPSGWVKIEYKNEK